MGVDLFAGYQHLHGLLARYIARQGNHRSGAEQANIHARSTEIGFIDCNGQIAGGNQLTTGSRGCALHFCNHQLWAIDDLLHELGTGLHDHGKIGAAPIFAGTTGGQLFQIMPAQKTGPLAAITINRVVSS